MLIKRHKSGVWLRPDTCDIYVPGQINQYKLLNVANNKILDLGGHIGCFSKYCVEQGCEFVTAFEPQPQNCDLFLLNMAEYDNVELVQSAVVPASVDGDLMLYQSITDTSAHSLTNIRGRVPITVTTLKLEDALLLSEATIVKLDIEGSEYLLLDDIINLFPDYGITQFAAELHLNLKDWRQRALDFVDRVQKLYKPIRPAIIGEKNWNTTGVWQLL